MLVELQTKAGNLCSQAKEGSIRCPLIVRPSSEDEVTGEIVEALQLINPRYWLDRLLNLGLGTSRFQQKVYRNLRIQAWVGKPAFPRELLKWDEGSTEVDLQITWENPATTVYIEAKYGSKLSTSTANNKGEHGFPGDQLIRNIRVGLHECGYYDINRLFDTGKRDFAVLVLLPERGQELVEKYQSELTVRESIPHSTKITELPVQPFVGEIGYKELMMSLKERRRFMSRLEQKIVDRLGDYLEFKRDHRPR